MGMPALAQQEEEDILQEITVIGSRSQERSAADQAVPVDVIDASQLLRQGASRMDTMLTRAIPSINVSEEPISDDATFIRPVTLCGLPLTDNGFLNISAEYNEADLMAIKDGLRSVVPDIYSIATVEWYANDFDTTTQGVDVVATYPAELMGGSTLFRLAMNYDKTEVDRISPVSVITPDSLDLIRVEDGTPDFRFTLSADHRVGPFGVLAQVRYYDSYTDIHAIDWHVQKMNARVLVDLELSYNVTDNIAVVAGTDNLFDTDSEKLGLDWNNEYSFGGLYPENSPFDTNGGFYYFKLRMSM